MILDFGNLQYNVKLLTDDELDRYNYNRQRHASIHIELIDDELATA